MSITALCPTYNRPRLLGQLVAMFVAQDYPEKRLLILDDAGQYGNREGDGWRIVSTDKRYPCVASKRNALARMAETDYIAMWDDDDWYFPWALSATANALKKGLWMQPRQALEWAAPGKLARYATNSPGGYDFCYGGCWAYRKKTYLLAGGSPETYGNGEDTILARKLWRSRTKSVDSICAEYPKPFYVYSRDMSGSWHASELGPGFEAMPLVGAMPREDVSNFKIELPSGYYEAAAAIPDKVLPRKW